MDLVIKIPLFILLGLIVFSLAEAMFFLARDDGSRDKTRMVRALTVRITLSLMLFVLLMAGYYFGLVEPHSK
ncbi:MAG: twin transmembrane helix small protein [Proteobacteria bacterium]|nr:MAG: twin transmembrane helix small protein [Pseudomonadota bacterium]QKK10567.1 MAG: twin transmembrane helix small protein [Pseudomonadota bacterium]